ERLVRLDPCFICYTPPADPPLPPPSPLQASGGRVTFGSFHSMLQTNDPPLPLWAPGPGPGPRPPPGPQERLPDPAGAPSRAVPRRLSAGSGRAAGRGGHRAGPGGSVPADDRAARPPERVRPHRPGAGHRAVRGDDDDLRGDAHGRADGGARGPVARRARG